MSGCARRRSLFVFAACCLLAALAPWLGVLAFVGAIVWLYRWMARRAMAVR